MCVLGFANPVFAVWLRNKTSNFRTSMLFTSQTIDLYEARDLAQVQVTLYKLGSAAQKNGFPGPVIGVKVAEKNVRNFDERRKKDGMNVIGLQVCR